jgi:hypothetical protein
MCSFITLSLRKKQQCLGTWADRVTKKRSVKSRIGAKCKDSGHMGSAFSALSEGEGNMHDCYRSWLVVYVNHNLSNFFPSPQ